MGYLLLREIVVSDAHSGWPWNDIFDAPPTLGAGRPSFCRDTLTRYATSAYPCASHFR